MFNKHLPSFLVIHSIIDPDECREDEGDEHCCGGRKLDWCWRWPNYTDYFSNHLNITISSGNDFGTSDFHFQINNYDKGACIDLSFTIIYISGNILSCIFT